MLKDLFRYTEVADNLVIDVFEKNHIELPQAEALFSHVINAQHIWVSRITQREITRSTHDIVPKETYRDALKQNMQDLFELLEKEDLSREIHFTTLAGDPFSSVISDILLHVVNHSTYHRAQIAKEFKLNGITPPSTDYIVLKRQGKF